MKVLAKQNRDLVLINKQNTQNENDAEKILLQVPEQYEDFNKKIVFNTKDGDIWDIIVNNEYLIPKAITKYEQVEFYIWLTKDDVDFRSKTYTLKFYPNIDASEEITPEEIGGVNTIANLLEEEITKVDNIDINAEKVGDTATITITNKDGQSTSIEIQDGEKGDKGDKGDTPQKYVDYYTTADKNEIEADVTNRVSSMIPDVSNFITASVNNLVNYYLKSDTYNKTEVDALISATKTGMFRTASVLPTPSIDTLNIIYLVPSEDPQTRNVKDEYITIEINNGYDWEKIGSTAIDLTGYATENWVNTQISDFLTDTEIQQLINTAVKGKYTKPSGGIPKTDLANDVQISLDNSKTVNGHTVESNVPANAQFTDTIYDDSYIKENIQTNATNIANNTKNIAKKANSTINNNVDVLETTKSTESIGDNQLFFNKGAIFGGTAMDAGLATRGICGITTPDSKGGCAKENLYVNYDGGSDYNAKRQLVIQAGNVGSHYGNNLYQFAAARGDAVKGYVDKAISSAVKGKYTKPETGIPKTDLAGTVQTSLEKADTAIQSSNFVYDSTTQTLTITTV